MQPSTRQVWELQDRHGSDRMNLFAAVREAVGGAEALYPGSFVDVAASAVFPSVTYVDTDRRTPGFFRDEAGVREIVSTMGGEPSFSYRFLHRDYREDLSLGAETFDILISLYAGFISEHCTEYLRIGGHLVANTSHGDVAMAAIDPRYELAGVVTSRAGGYRTRYDGLDQYLIPKKPGVVTKETLHHLGRGIGYTRQAAAYLFRRVA